MFMLNAHIFQVSIKCVRSCVRACVRARTCVCVRGYWLIYAIYSMDGSNPCGFLVGLYFTTNVIYIYIYIYIYVCVCVCVCVWITYIIIYCFCYLTFIRFSLGCVQV